MSGGKLDYFFGSLEDHAEDFGDRELADLVKDLATLYHDREWYLSGDTSLGDWRKSRDEFKKKWLKEGGNRERIERYLHDIERDIREELGLSHEYCHTCSHFTNSQKSACYGSCSYEKHCMVHTHDRCDRWEPRTGGGESDDT